MPPVNTVSPRPAGTAPVTAPVTTLATPAPAPATTATTATTATGTAPAATFGGTTHTTPTAPVSLANVAAGGLTPLMARFGALTQDPAAAARLAALAGALDPAVLAALSTPAGLKATVDKLCQDLVASNGASITPAAEKQVFNTLAQLKLAGQLQPALHLLAAQAQASGALPANMPAQQKEVLIMKFSALLDAELEARGTLPGTENKVFEGWSSLSQKHLEAVRKTSVPPAGPGSPSAFENPVFIQEFETLVGARFSNENLITPLIDGPASFKERDRMIDGAKKSIHLMTWAFYDDETGLGTARKLVARHQQGVDVKVMVDGNVAKDPHHAAALKLMEDAGIPVIRWNDPNRAHDGQHRKVMVVDGKEAVSGGINLGNFYSHQGPPDGQKWRDTDVLMRGKVVTDAHRMFASLWNEQIKLRNLALPPMHIPAGRPAEPGDTRALVINDTPGPQGNASIMLATLKAIEGATQRVDIENAYFIQTPALRDALLKALERGVEVRILTNSAQSVDEPIVSAPILNSLPELVEKGAKVFLKQGDTLHSKFLVVDGLFTQVGSYNLHPRSERYEGEMVVAAVDRKLGAQMQAAFEKDIAAATAIASAADVQVPKTAFSILASRFFFDQL